MKLNQIIEGEALEILKTLSSESIDCIITSPPYWGLRDYGTGKWEGGNNPLCDHKIPESEFDPKNPDSGSHIMRFNRDSCYKCGAKRVDRQLGLEPKFEDYISKLCDIFDEVKRILKKEGTCWVNIGDTYSAQRWSGKGEGQPTNKMRDGHRDINPEKIIGMPNKCLVQIPSRFAIEMVNRGWILRNEIIWHKPNCMPSSADDRFTVDFEKIFFFTKNQKYFFEQQLDPYTKPLNRWGGDRLIPNGKSDWDKGTGQTTYRHKNMRPNPFGKNKRAVWRITTKPFKEAHFAVFPEELIQTPILAGCPKGGTVLDPFMGAGTTGLVAKKLGRSYIGIELNPEYVEMAESRINSCPTPLL